jgi:glutathione S-transferase
MTVDARGADPYTLWSTPHSLYSGKVRSYLIKKRLAYRELYPPHPAFQGRIVPAVKSMVIPVLETPDGAIVQDTTDIIDYLEARHPAPPMNPATPVQRTAALLLDAFGSEYLLALAMHYRWSYRAEQEHFLRAEFGRAVHTGPDREARLQTGSQVMAYFSGFLPRLGVVSETIPTLEASYAELLDALDVHFQTYPYLLGGRPSVADFGLMAPLFAHLARDPVPAMLMKTRAPNVYRWTERMNIANIADGEFPDCPENYLADDAIPATLEPVLRLVFSDWGPGLHADAVCFNAWVERQPSLKAGHPASISEKHQVHPTLGPVEYAWRGITMRRASAPHGLWHFERAAGFARGLSGDARTRLDELLQRTGGSALTTVRLSRQLTRENYALVIA